MTSSLDRSARATMADVESTWWSATVLDASGNTLVAHRSDAVRSVASVGKLLLLAELDARLDADPAAFPYRLTKTAADTVTDSGLWQHMTIDALGVHDLAVLIASTSDNLATNVLLRHLGLDLVAQRSRALGLRQTALHDYVRDQREPPHAERLASGTASELARFIAGGSQRLLDWMELSTDYSMVGGLLGLDPLVANGGSGPLGLANKTGSDAGVRCDVGRLSGPAGILSYAVLVNWDGREPIGDTVGAAMQNLGRRLADFLLDA